MEKEYEPFGDEWKSHLMKLPKKHLIDLYKKVCLELKDGKSRPVEPEVSGKFAEEIIGCIPTNWLDPLLTGKDKILPDGYSYTPKDIEKLLLALKNRVKEKVSKFSR